MNDAGTDHLNIVSGASNATTGLVVQTGGNVGIGTTLPSALLSVGATSQFQVDTSGNITTSGDLALNGGDITTTAATFNIANGTATTINIGGTAATTLNFGADGNLTRAINIGTGTGVDTINIGTGLTGADIINIGSTAAGALTVRSGAALTLAGSTNSIIDFPNFDVATTGNITTQAGYGLDTNAAGVLALGNITATTVNIGNTAATTLSLGALGNLD